MNHRSNPVVPSGRTASSRAVAALLGVALVVPVAAGAQNASSLFAVGGSARPAPAETTSAKTTAAKATASPAATAKASPTTTAGKATTAKTTTAKTTAAKTTAAKTTAAKTTAAKAAAAKPAARPAAKPGPTRQADGRSGAARRTAAADRQRKGTTRPAGPLALGGRWQDAECVPLVSARQTEPLFVKRHYHFDDKARSWQLDATVFSDGHCSPGSQMLSYRGQGSYTLTGRSRVADNAWEASFRAAGWQATPINRDGVMALLNARCGSGEFTAGRTLDLSKTGCAPLGIQPLASRTNELELVRIADGRFYLGSRGFLPAARDERPAQLSSYGLERAPKLSAPN